MLRTKAILVAGLAALIGVGLALLLLSRLEALRQTPEWRYFTFDRWTPTDRGR